MTRKILLPTDFSIDSLITLKAYFQNDQSTNDYEVILLHGYMPSDSITEMLLFSKSKLLNDLKLEPFLDATEILKNKFDTKIKSIKIDVFSGLTQASFDNYLVGQRIEEIIMSDQYNFRPVSRRSFNLNKFVSRCKIQVTHLANLNWEYNSAFEPDTQDLATLFNPSYVHN